MLSLTFIPASTFAETPEERGLAIARKARELDSGFGDVQASFSMILRDESGRTAERAVRMKRLETVNDGNKTLVIFDLPKDIAGTAFLAFTHRSGPDEQWLYLPALKRVKRIALNNISSPFMGSEFSYEDIASQELEKYRFKFLSESACPDGVAQCFINEQTPLNENSGYSRLMVWIHSRFYRTEKVEFYDRNNELLKVLTNSDYRQYLERYWRPGKMDMKNIQTERRTELIWGEYRFKTGLTDRDFDQNSLQRAR
jgi:outer membrane lipoprotein-sorting protein